MMVDLPQPVAPTMAVVLPASKVKEKSSSTGMSGRDGYEKLTFLSSISGLS